MSLVKGLVVAAVVTVVVIVVTFTCRLLLPKVPCQACCTGFGVTSVSFLATVTPVKFKTEFCETLLAGPAAARLARSGSRRCKSCHSHLELSNLKSLKTMQSLN